MISDNSELLTFKIDAPEFDSMYNCEKFLFMNRIVLFSKREFLRFIRNRLISFSMVLTQDSTNSQVRCISCDGERFGRIR